MSEVSSRTLKLAKALNLVETIEIDKEGSIKYNKQVLDYLLVLDFESTCWGPYDTDKAPPEIIEFSVVLYNIADNKIVSEFQQYVMPTERPYLSAFCQNFTGITQTTVNNGVPIGTCLMLFRKWVDEVKKSYKIGLHEADNKDLMLKKAVFVTWSDWDLNTCLQKECQRKRILKSDIFNKWIDLRALYKEYYQRRPKGLKGALSELGLSFEGKEHCGLHDARNTAYLAGRMVKDGIILQITKDISK